MKVSDSTWRCKKTSRIFFGIVFCLAAFGFLPADALENTGPEATPICVEARRWEAADRIFRSDPRWIGGDGATSIDLGNGRVLWLFGDSFIDLSGSGTRKTSTLVRNSIAVQTGYDPSLAEMAFFWKTDGSQPADFFPPAGDSWYWPASGIMVGKRLLIFLMEIRAAENELGFAVSGWKAVMVDNPRENPGRWNLIFLKSPQKGDLIVGSGNPILEKGFLMVFAAAGSDRSVYLVRWPERFAIAGTLTRPEWWSGDETGWVEADHADTAPKSIIAAGQMEFTVEYLPEKNRYLQVQTLSILDPCVAASSAAEITGPWSPQACFYVPPEKGLPGNLIYAGKSHPILSGADMVFTYVVNSTKEEVLLNDMSVYFPIMLKGRICDCRTE